MSFFIVWRSYLKYWLEIFIDVIFIVTWFRTHNSYSKSEKEISWACRSQTAHICSLLPHQWWGNRKHWSISLTLVLLVWGWESRGHSLKAAIFEISIQLEGLDLCCIIFRVYHSQYLKEWSDFICINMLLAYHYKYCTVELSSVDPLIGLVKEDECCTPAIELWQCPNSFAPWASFLLALSDFDPGLWQSCNQGKWFNQTHSDSSWVIHAVEEINFLMALFFVSKSQECHIKYQNPFWNALVEQKVSNWKTWRSPNPWNPKEILSIVIPVVLLKF